MRPKGPAREEWESTPNDFMRPGGSKPSLRILVPHDRGCGGAASQAASKMDHTVLIGRGRGALVLLADLPCVRRAGPSVYWLYVAERWSRQNKTGVVYGYGSKILWLHPLAAEVATSSHTCRYPFGRDIDSQPERCPVVLAAPGVERKACPAGWKPQWRPRFPCRRGPPTPR